MDIPSVKRQTPALKGAGLTPPALCSEPTRTPCLWLSWLAEAGSGCGCVDLDSRRLLMGGTPLRHLSGSTPHTLQSSRIGNREVHGSDLLNLDCKKTLFKNLGFLVHIIFWISWHPWGRKLSPHAVLQPSPSPPAEAWREDPYYLMTSKTGLQIENSVVNLQISKWKNPPQNGMKMLLSF